MFKSHYTMSFAFFLLSGCAGVSGDYPHNLEDYKYSQAYKLDQFLRGTHCMGRVEFKAPDSDLANYVITYKLSTGYEPCIKDAQRFVTAQCNKMYFDGMYNYGREFCTDRNGVVLFSWDSEYSSFYLSEPLRGKENEWDKYAKERLGYESTEDMYARQKRESAEKERKDNELLSQFEKYIKGEPFKIKKSPIGTRICKLSGDAKSTIIKYSNRPAEWEMYVAGLENKSSDKVLVRYKYHGSKFSAYDDVNGLIRWENSVGWYVCE